MSELKLQGGSSGSSTYIIQGGAGDTNRTFTLPNVADTTISSIRDRRPENLLINGGMNVWQRATSQASISSTSTDGYVTADRWETYNNSLGTWTQSQSTDVPSGQGFGYSLKMDCTTADASPAAGDELVIIQKIEAQNLQHLLFGTSSAKSITLSFWVKSNKTGTYIINLVRTDVSNRHISKSYTISSADTWEKKEITFDGDTTNAIANDNGRGIDFNFYLAAGSNYTSGTLATSWEALTTANRAVGQVNLADSTSNEWYMTGCQLEVGDTATDFQFEPYETVLRKCQRYFWYGEISGAATADNDYNKNYMGNSFPVTMRDTPGITRVSGALVGHGGFNADETTRVTKDSVTVGWSGSNYRDIGAAGHQILKADAEL